MSADQPCAPYEPTILDVLVVKAMLLKGLGLPAEIIDNIIDQADYWPHTVSIVEYNTVGGKVVSSSEGDELLIRAVPLGFLEWPAQRPAENEPSDVPPPIYGPANYFPGPPGVPHSPDAFQQIIGYPDGILSHPCRKIVFTFRSRDQGWGGHRDDANTFRGSWTWFEAGLERWCEDTATPDAAPKDSESSTHGRGDHDGTTIATPTAERSNAGQPSLNIRDLHSIYPTNNPDESVGGFQHPLLPQEHLKIQCNRVASRVMEEHQVVWRYDDYIDPKNKEKAAAQLTGRGRGTETANGEFVRSLCLGDVITVWGKARFPGWVNFVEKVKVEVYWAV